MVKMKSRSSLASAPTKRVSPPERRSCRPRAGIECGRPAAPGPAREKRTQVGAPEKFSTGLWAREPVILAPSGARKR